MNERISKLLLMIETLVCLMPVTLITALYAAMLVAMFMSGMGVTSGTGSERWVVSSTSAFTFLGLALQLYGWKVIRVFLAGGRDGIKWIDPRYIYAIVLGAGLVSLAGLALLMLSFDLQPPGFLLLLLINSCALPALIPFTHVMLEWWWSLRR